MGMVVVVMATFLCVSCKDDPENGSGAKALVGTWVCQEQWDDVEDVWESVTMTLTFKNDNTGKIVENWRWGSRADGSSTYSMEFNWSCASDSNGNNILQVSYVSGDKDTELFEGYENTVLWKCQYVLTGKILNVYSDGEVWVFNKK